MMFDHLRLTIAKAVYPEVFRPLVPVEMEHKLTLLTLCDTLAAHLGVTHFAISMRALRKGDFFLKLREPSKGCTIRTWEKLMSWFDANWPSDLEWPRHIPRPRSPKKKEAA